MPPYTTCTSETEAGRAILKILDQGEAWGTRHRGRREFTLTVVQARMARATLTTIEKFVRTRGGEPWPKQVGHSEDAVAEGETLKVTVAKHEEFEAHEGEQVHQPYLQFYCSRRDDLALGLSKCQAILDVWPHIEAFLAQNNASPQR